MPNRRLNNILIRVVIAENFHDKILRKRRQTSPTECDSMYIVVGHTQIAVARTLQFGLNYAIDFKSISFLLILPPLLLRWCLFQFEFIT